MTNDNPVVRIVAPMALLQTIRASHAISEAGYTLSVTKTDEAVFAALANAFPDTIRLSSAEGRKVAIDIDHRTPLTSIGSVSRPLIFPTAMVDRCRTFWSRERDIYCVFRGLMTRRRKKVVARARRALNQGLWSWFSSGSKRNVVFTGSKKGRVFPVKSWDEPFYAELGNSQFALCPKGDHVWTYRFFEAVLCGAIPVVEGVADCYGGFRYHTLEELGPDLEWSEKDALYNFERCRSLVTVPTEELSTAVEMTITQARYDE